MSLVIGARAVSQGGDEQKTKEELRKEWKIRTQKVSGAGSSSRKSAERAQSWSGSGFRETIFLFV